MYFSCTDLEKHFKIINQFIHWVFCLKKLLFQMCVWNECILLVYCGQNIKNPFCRSRSFLFLSVWRMQQDKLCFFQFCSSRGASSFQHDTNFSPDLASSCEPINKRFPSICWSEQEKESNILKDNARGDDRKIRRNQLSKVKITFDVRWSFTQMQLCKTVTLELIRIKAFF